MDKCSICGSETPVTRPGRIDYGEPSDSALCFECDHKLINHLMDNYSHIPGADDFAGHIESFWSHPSALTKLQEMFNKPTLQVIKGEGQNPRTPEDPRPNLKVVGWKIIRTAKCYCAECEVARESNPNIQTDHDIDDIVEEYNRLYRN